MIFSFSRLPPVVRLVVLIFAAGVAFLLVTSLQQQAGTFVQQAKRSL